MKTIVDINATPVKPAAPQLAERFRLFSRQVAQAAGSPWAFIAGVLITLVWAFTGQYFDYSENWQLVINTGTTIVTFLMVFVIQNTQSRDSKELHLKLDELLRAIENARNTIINCADLSDEELEEMHAEIHSHAPPPHNGPLVVPDGTVVTRPS